MGRLLSDFLQHQREMNENVYRTLNIPPGVVAEMVAQPTTYDVMRDYHAETFGRIEKAAERFAIAIRGLWPRLFHNRPRSKRWRRPKRWRARDILEHLGVQGKGFRGIVRSAQEKKR